MKYHSRLPLLKVFYILLVMLSFAKFAQAQATFSPTSNTFPNTNVGASSAVVDFVVTNISGGDLNPGTAISIGGTNGSDFTYTITQTNPWSNNTSATVRVTFIPTAFGSRSAQLNVSSSSATLSGVGIGPEINVTGVADGVSATMTNVDLGSSTTTSTRTFTINNPGNAPLSISDITGQTANFAVTTDPAASVAAGGGTTTFVVTFQPLAPGLKTATISINSNAPAPRNAYTISLSATATAPEIVVDQPAGTNILTGGPRSFGSVALGSTGDLTFTIKNTGDSNLTGLGITLGGSHPGDFSITANPTAPVAGPSGSTTFTVRFTPTVSGLRSSLIQIANNDLDEAPFEINVSGTGLAPDIRVESPPGTPVLAALPGADLGTVVAGTVRSVTFNVLNTGNAPLVMTNATLVSGTHSSITIKSNLTSLTVAGGASAQFVLQFAPTVSGSFTGSLSIPTNVSGKNPYVVAFTGIGGATIPNTDAFGYSMDVAAPASDNAYLKDTDTDVRVPGELLLDDAYLFTDIGFNFKFYEKSYTKCYISTNGVISFDGGVTAWSPPSIPNAGAPNNYIAPFWTDLNPGAGAGKIRYATRGTAPNRTFIVMWDQIPEYYVPTRKVTFQISLYEGSNSIEVQYKSIDAGFGDTRTYVNMGIESRDYGTSGPRPADSVIGLSAAYGLVDSANKTVDNLPIKSFPYSIRYTRPVMFTVESNYERPGSAGVFPTPSLAGTDNSILPLAREKPHYGNIRGTDQRFEAPEFIYMDRNFGKLASPGDVNGLNDQIAWYRLVNDGYAIDGQVVQGTHTFFSTTLNSDINVVWRWRLEIAAIVDSGKPNGGSVNDAGRRWLKPGDQFVAVLDTPLEDFTTSSGMRLKVTGYDLYDKNVAQIGSTIPVVAGSYVESSPLTMASPVRLRWNWVGEVRYRFDAADSQNVIQNSQAFIQIWSGVVPPGPDPVANPGILGTAGSPILSVGKDHAVWVPIRSKITVGAFYRTSDRRLTLTDFPGAPGGDLTPDGTFVSALDDAEVSSRVARVRTTVALTPTDIHWVYAPTVFRAEIPIGQGFDPANPNPQLVPDLAPNGILKLDGSGPGTSISTVIDSPEGSYLNGSAVRWDGVGKQLFPTQLGTHRVQWPDARGNGETYTIEVVTAFPGEKAALATARENDNGARQGAAPNYVRLTPDLAPVSSDYPAAPVAHYRHLFDPIASRQPPTKLDLKATDEWAFQEMTFAEKDTAAVVNKTASGVPFNTNGSGRSVLLYSYRPNTDEIADGNLAKERLAVRIVRSGPMNVITRNDAKLVLGRHALQLGTGPATGGAYGLIQTGASPATTSLDPGNKFVVDFWLNSKGLKTSLPVTLANCVTIGGTTMVTCASTASVTPGMGISGPNIPAGTKIASVTSATTLQLSTPATANGTGLTMTGTNKPVTVVSTGGGGLKVTLDPAGSTATATYRGVQVSHQLPKAGVAWRHFAIHVFTNRFFGVDLVIIDFYLDGVRQEKGFVASWFPGAAQSTVGTTVQDNSLRFGIDAEARSGLLLDNFRVFNLGTDPLGYLSSGEVRTLRTERDMTVVGKELRSVGPPVSFDFEAAPSSGRFPHQGSLLNVGIGNVTGSGLYVGKWADTDLQEVATRVESTLDNASFGGSGYILNAVSNYNMNLYTRTAEVGTWGPIFPVNHNQLFVDVSKKLEVAYYENPYLAERSLNPNVAWPYVATSFNDVVFPTFGKDKDKAIYIASRIGSEGVDRSGFAQQVFDAASYSDLQIYQQSNLAGPGYNPNEEHALVAPGGRTAFKVKNQGEDVPNSPPLAAFALQRDINTRTIGYTSDPWVLVQVNNVATGEPEMAAYQVFKTRTGTVDFPRPNTAVVNAAGSGLSYEAASNPEDGFLMIDSSKAVNFSYQFEYPAFAGDLLIPPYPLNLVIGNVAMRDARGNSLQVGGINQRSLWRDVNSNAWVVSGNGRFFHQFFYPFRGDFFLPGAQAGTPVAWIPDDGMSYTGTGANLHPVKVLYNSSWRSDYPKLKRGETLTYQGGEYFNESPGAKGLPALVAMAASEIVYDSSTPSMSYGTPTTNRYDISSASARLMRPLDRRENLFTVSQMGSAGFTPAATTKVLIIAERWYFKELPGSLQKRFYFDSLAEKLVFRGRLNEKESGDSNLTSGPDPLNILEPNVLTSDEYNRVRALSGDPAWTAAIDQIYLKVQNPEAVTGGNNSASAAARNLQGVKNTPGNYPADLSTFWVKSGSLYYQTTSPAPAMVPLDSFGVGSALVPNPSLLTQAPNGSLYVTIAENNRSELTGAPVSLHIIEIIPDRYRGAIKVIEGSDAFSEKVTLQHNGEFGANTADLYYEWWIRDAGPLDLVATEVLANGTLKETDSNGQTLWQEYIPAERASLTDNNAKHLGLHTIVFEGRPDVVLADKLVLMRYRHKNEANWKLVPFEFANASTAWKPGTIAPVSAAPFQWAGAANSPQLQADGSKRYIPQLVMGWVKRVLDRINPYEARYNDFFSNESPATYSSQIQIAGGPYAGKVALNPDKNVIENTGLIELYRTVLDRARELSIDNSSNPVSTDGINQALLLAATRLSVLYELLANEAYSDAQDSTINSGEDSSLVGIVSYTHAFQNMEADLQHEELALLRGTDFGKSYPVYNRIFWNYAKGLGEAAYNVNYNIYDVNQDGFINEDDARKLYPQGHGDAWGHYVSALDMSYVLLRHPGFTWRTRSELYSLMQNVLEVDFLDEKTFARLASARARAGRDIVRETYRLHYTHNPNGQWQGYTDGADPARAWGVSEWAHRAGQSAHFDWAVANALLPEEADAATPISNPENLDRIERSGSVDDIGAIAAGLHEIQVAMDEANKGTNPLGFDSDAMAFDIEMESSHFEQIYDRAAGAANNALATLEMATQSQNKLRSVADDTDGLIQEAMAQDLDFRNRLIEIFGRPYDGTIGVGKAYPEGYLGPDTLLFAYLDKTRIDQIVPPKTGGSNVVTFDLVKTSVLGIMNKASMVTLYNGAYNGNGGTQLRSSFETLIGANNYLFEPASGATFTAPYTTASKYAFQAPVGWGQRTSYGRTQASLNSMLATEIELDSALSSYTSDIMELQNKLRRIDSQLAIFQTQNSNHDEIARLRRKVSDTVIGLETTFGIISKVAAVVYGIAEVGQDAAPTSIGFSNDIGAIPRAIFGTLNGIARVVELVAETVKELSVAIVTRDGEANEFKIDLRNAQLDQVAELEGMIEEFQSMTGNEQPLRNAIGSAIQNLEASRQEYITAQAEGFRLLREREAYNKILAAKVQKNRYQDMVFRLSRNEAMSKYQSSFNAAARYAWLAARAYDYETSLDPGHSAAPGPVLDKIIKERQLGFWSDGEPQVGRGGLAEILAQLKGNFDVLKGQLGINNPQNETEKISLRQELFRIHALDPELSAALDLQASVTLLNIPESQLTIQQRQLLATLDDSDNQEAIAQAPASNDRWKDALKARLVPNLNTMPEFVRHCRPFASGVQPGLAIRFSTTIEPGKNFFGHSLMADDHIYSTANFATKIHSLGVWLDDYNSAGLSITPRAYLIPLGDDYLRTSTSTLPIVRSWSLVEQRIPTPFVINQSTLRSPEYIPTLNGVDGSFSDLRRYGDFRIYHNNGDPEADDSELIMDSRLTGRSVWNSQWMLVIPGSGLGVDPDASLKKLADNISDIKLYFSTTSHQGQ
jgi:hypothetical protein